MKIKIRKATIEDLEAVTEVEGIPKVSIDALNR